MSESETDHGRQLLESVLAEGRRDAGRNTPPFEEVWSRAVAASTSPRARRLRQPRLRLALAAAAVAVLVAASTIALWVDSRRSRQLERAMTAVTAVGEWRAPLDFLLETPGREWLGAPPRWDPGSTATAPWGIAPGLPETDPPKSPIRPEEAST
jgi:hypothetical protein